MSRRVTVKLGFQGPMSTTSRRGDPRRRSHAVAVGRLLTVGYQVTPRLDGPLKATGGASLFHIRRRDARDDLRRDPAQPVCACACAQRRSCECALRLPGVRAALKRDDQKIVRFAATGSPGLLSRAGFQIAYDAIAIAHGRLRSDAVRGRNGRSAQTRFAAGSLRPAAIVRLHPKSGSSAATSVDGPRGGGGNDRGDLFHTGSDARIARNSRMLSLASVGMETSSRYWCSTQGIFTVRDDLAVLFNLPPDKVRVITPSISAADSAQVWRRRPKS